VKRRKPKPVILEPATASLLRLGREMGRDDVCSVLLVRDPILSAAVSRAVDRELGDRERAKNDQVENDMRRGLLFSKYCHECGVRCTQFGMVHADDCDIDRTLSAQQRWKLRHPEWVAPGDRLNRIKRRWALLARAAQSAPEEREAA
jgi:hypothetical protein